MKTSTKPNRLCFTYIKMQNGFYEQNMLMKITVGVVVHWWVSFRNVYMLKYDKINF